MIPILFPLLAAALAAGIWLTASMKLLRNHERAILIRIGRLVPGLRGPGVLLTLPGLDRLLRFDLDALDRAGEALAGAHVPPAEAAKIVSELQHARAAHAARA